MSLNEWYFIIEQQHDFLLLIGIVSTHLNLQSMYSPWKSDQLSNSCCKWTLSITSQKLNYQKIEPTENEILSVQAELRQYTESSTWPISEGAGCAAGCSCAPISCILCAATYDLSRERSGDLRRSLRAVVVIVVSEVVSRCIAPRTQRSASLSLALSLSYCIRALGVHRLSLIYKRPRTHERHFAYISVRVAAHFADFEPQNRWLDVFSLAKQSTLDDPRGNEPWYEDLLRE